MLYKTRNSAFAKPLKAVLPTSLKRRGSEMYFNTLLESPITSRLSRQLERAIEPLTAERRAVLVEKYRDSVEKLEERLGRALPDWKR
jgi:hypothetical protein